MVDAGMQLGYHAFRKRSVVCCGMQFNLKCYLPSNCLIKPGLSIHCFMLREACNELVEAISASVRQGNARYTVDTTVFGLICRGIEQNKRPDPVTIAVASTYRELLYH